MRNAAAEGPVKRAFVSHVREDSAQIDEICGALEAAGIPYWRDHEQLGPGDDWRDKIREAISSDSLAFLACFSPNSAVKAKSYMNEELQLAISEYRLRPPGRPWLIPVLLGPDAEIPDQELTPNRRLTDLQGTRLFAEDAQKNLIRLLTRVSDVVAGDRPNAATARAAVEQARTAEQRAERVLELAKKMLTDPSRRIELDDLIGREVRRITTTITDPQWLSPKLRDPEIEWAADVVVRGQDLWGLTEPFCASIFAAARWGEPEQVGPWVAGLRSLGASAEKVLGGKDVMLSLRRLPVAVALMTAGLGAVSAGRWSTLKALVGDVTVRNPRYNDSEPLLSSTNPWTPFGNDGIANTFARASLTGADPVTAAQVVKDGHRYRTPPAEWMHHALRPIFEDVLADEDVYSLEFDRAEIMLGVIAEDQFLQRQATTGGRRWYPEPHWYGRAGWRSGYGQSSPLQELEGDFALQGWTWGPLAAGLFGGSLERAEAAFERFRGGFQERAERLH